MLFVTGKGGTGKSTCAAALSLVAARRGLRVLLVEVECSSSAKGVFGIRKPGMLPKRSSSGVDVVSIEFQKGVEEVVHDVMGVPRVVRVMLRHPVISRFLRAAPSTLDFVTLYLTTRFVESRDKRGARTHDLVIVDMPAFGHARLMLSVGKTTKDLFRVGPLATRGALVEELTHDGDRAAVVAVTLPEEMPVTETLEGCSALLENGLPMGPVIMNCSRAPQLSDQQLSMVEQMARAAEQSGDEPGAHALARAAEWTRWAKARQARIDELRDKLTTGQKLVSIPLFPGAVAGMPLIARIADALESAEPEVAVETQ